MMDRNAISGVGTAIPDRYRAERARVLRILDRWRRSCNGESIRWVTGEFQPVRMASGGAR